MAIGGLLFWMVPALLVFSGILERGYSVQEYEIWIWGPVVIGIVLLVVFFGYEIYRMMSE